MFFGGRFLLLLGWRRLEAPTETVQSVDQYLGTRTATPSGRLGTSSWRRKGRFLVLAPETLAPLLLPLPDSIRIRYEPRSHPKHGWLKCVHKLQARTPNVSKGFKLGIPANGACTDCEFQEALLRSFEEARCWSLEQVYPVTEAAV